MLGNIQIMGKFQKLGRSLMLPIAVLPAAALILRFGQEDLLDIAFVANAGQFIFDNLALLFAVGLAIGFSRDGSGAAALAGVVGYLILTGGLEGINEDIDMGVFGGVIAGITAGLLYNRFYNIQLPQFLGFFGGRRFVPIITAVTMLVFAFIFGYVWPPIQTGIDQVTGVITDTGAAGAGLYGFLNRLLIPTGLHHIINTFIWFDFGSFQGYNGEITRFLNGDPDAGAYTAGFFPIMMFGLPGACLAMILAAKPERRKEVAGMLGSLALTSFLTGITEPIEFTFMFLSPLLYVVHALMTGLAMVVTFQLGILDAFGFSAGFIDYLLNFGIATKPVLLLGVGLVFGVLYFVVFSVLIRLLNIKTPGREDEETVTTTNTFSGEGKYESLAKNYVAALGGYSNIQSIDNCVTRLRLQMNDMDEVDEDQLKQNGARGVVKVDKTNLQVIIGTEVEFVADAMRTQDPDSTVE